MSRQVDLTKPISDDDRAYLKRKGRYWDIEANDSAFGKIEVGQDFAGEVGADHAPEPDGTVGAARTTTGEDPRVTAAAESAGSDNVSEDDKVSVADVKKLNKGDMEDELRALDPPVEPVDGNKDAVQEQLLEELRKRNLLAE